MNEHDENSGPVELDAADLELVSGGLNPQPLPPHVEPELAR